MIGPFITGIDISGREKSVNFSNNISLAWQIKLVVMFVINALAVL